MVVVVVMVTMMILTMNNNQMKKKKKEERTIERRSIEKAWHGRREGCMIEEYNRLVRRCSRHFV